jgi:cytochrome bd-type quinol oxidase subunit 2
LQPRTALARPIACVLLGACGLIRKTEGELHERAARSAEIAWARRWSAAWC